MPLNRLQTTILGLLGPMARATWTQGPLRGSRGINGRCQSTECPCHRHFQPLVRRFSHKCMCPFLGWGAPLFYVHEDVQIPIGGGGRLGVEFGPGTPAMGSGVHIQEKSYSGPGSKSTHNGRNTQRNFDPPPHQDTHPSPQKRGPQVRWARGVKIKKIIGGSFSVPK